VLSRAYLNNDFFYPDSASVPHYRTSNDATTHEIYFPDLPTVQITAKVAEFHIGMVDEYDHPIVVCSIKDTQASCEYLNFDKIPTTFSVGYITVQHTFADKKSMGTEVEPTVVGLSIGRINNECRFRKGEEDTNVAEKLDEDLDSKAFHLSIDFDRCKSIQSDTTNSAAYRMNVLISIGFINVSFNLCDIEFLSLILLDWMVPITNEINQLQHLFKH